MSINLLKRLESSVYSFRLTLDRIKELINGTIQTIKNYRSGGCMLDLTDMSNAQDFDYDDQNTDFFSVGKKVKSTLRIWTMYHGSGNLKRTPTIWDCSP